MRAPCAIALFVAPCLVASGSTKDVEPFLNGMTVLFDGSHPVALRVETPACLLIEDIRRRVGDGNVLPLDLWILDENGARLGTPAARLLDPAGEPHRAKRPGHWRVELPAVGVWRLSVPALPRPWRLWSAFHPFLVRAGAGLTLRVRGDDGAVFLDSPGRDSHEIRLTRRSGQVRVSLSGPSQPSGGEAIVRDSVVHRLGGQTGRWALRLRGDGVVDLKPDRGLRWVAFLPWDDFQPEAPRIRVEGETRQEPGEPSELRAFTSDPDEDVAEIAWHIGDQRVASGSKLNMEVTQWVPFVVRTVVRDRAGHTASTETLVFPPAIHVRNLPGTTIVEAEEFVRTNVGRKVFKDFDGLSGKALLSGGGRGRVEDLEYELEVKKDGLYTLYAYYAAPLGEAWRRITLDGAAPHKAYEQTVFAFTGAGADANIRSWSTVRLGPPVQLTAGRHRLRIADSRRDAKDILWLDYVALVETR